MMRQLNNEQAAASAAATAATKGKDIKQHRVHAVCGIRARNEMQDSAPDTIMIMLHTAPGTDDMSLSQDTTFALPVQPVEHGRLTWAHE